MNEINFFPLLIPPHRFPLYSSIFFIPFTILITFPSAESRKEIHPCATTPLFFLLLFFLLYPPLLFLLRLNRILPLLGEERTCHFYLFTLAWMLFLWSITVRTFHRSVHTNMQNCFVTLISIHTQYPPLWFLMQVFKEMIWHISFLPTSTPTHGMYK